MNITYIRYRNNYYFKGHSSKLDTLRLSTTNKENGIPLPSGRQSSLVHMISIMGSGCKALLLTKSI